MLKKGQKKSNARIKFIELHKDENQLVFCIYSNKLLYKKGNEI